MGVQRQVVFLSQRREEPHNTDIQEAQTTPEMRLEQEATGSWWWSRANILGVDFRIRLIDSRPLRFMRYREESLELVRKAMEIAKQQGATDIGLGSLVASIAHGGADLLDDAGRLGLRLDHGDDMSTGLAAQAAWRLGDLGLDLKNSTIGIIGAVGIMGAGFAKLLAPFVGKLVLVVRRDDERAQRLKDHLEKKYGLEAVVTNDFQALQREGCDVVYVALNDPLIRLTPEVLKPKTLVLDACIPPAVRAEDFVSSGYLVIPVGCGTLPQANFSPNGVGVNLGLGQYSDNRTKGYKTGSIVYGCMLGCTLAARQGDSEHRIHEVDPVYANQLLTLGKGWGIIHQPFPLSEDAVADFIGQRS